MSLEDACYAIGNTETGRDNQSVYQSSKPLELKQKSRVWAKYNNIFILSFSTLPKSTQSNARVIPTTRNKICAAGP